MRGAGDEYRRQRHALGIGVVAEHTGLGNGQGGVLDRRVAIVAGDRRAHGEGHGGHVAFEVAIGVLVSEAVGPDEARVWDVEERPVGVERECAVAWTADRTGREGRARVQVGVVTQDAIELGDRGVEGHLAGEGGGRPIAVLHEAGGERDEVARSVVARLGHRELAVEGVRPAAVTADVQARDAARLERPARGAGVGPGHESGLVRRREVERPGLAGRRDVELHGVRVDSAAPDAGGDGAVGRGEIVGLSLADVVARLAIHHHVRRAVPAAVTEEFSSIAYASLTATGAWPTVRVTVATLLSS